MKLGVSAVTYDLAAPIAGRSLTRSKAPGRLFPIGQGPLYADWCVGPYLTDVDGNRYIDMLCALGAVVLGHGNRPHHDMVASLPSLPSKVEAAAAEAVLRVVAPWASSVRFVKTGSECTHAAYRIAKRATGRKHFLYGDWAYHGWHETFERAPNGTPEHPHAHLYRHGAGPEPFDIAGTLPEALIPPDQIAAVFVEPHRWEPVDREWLQWIREWCTEYGILLVFDEMIYGGRWAKGGATEYFGVIPDIACFGKAFGNGAPIAFVVGRDAVAEHGELVSGTYSGETLALSVLCDVLLEYERADVIGTLWKRGRQLRRGMNEIAADTRGQVTVEGEPVHQRFVFPSQELAQSFSAAMAQRGVLWHPACTNVMMAHTPEIIERVIEAAEASMCEVMP